MTWPTSTISTANLDAGSDKPSLARADLKQMADTVNAITSTLAISGANDGDVIAYNSGTDTWEYRDAGTVISASLQEVLVKVDSGTFNFTSGRYTLPISEVNDPSGLISISSNTFSLTAGTYLIQSYGAVSLGTGSPQKMDLYNSTDSQVAFALDSTFQASGNTNSPISINTWGKIEKLVLTGTKSFNLTVVPSGVTTLYYGGYSSGGVSTVAYQQLLIKKVA